MKQWNTNIRANRQRRQETILRFRIFLRDIASLAMIHGTDGNDGNTASANLGCV